MAGFLSEPSQREKALAAVQEAVLIRRELAAAHPDAFRSDLALALNNLAVTLSSLGRWEAAPVAQEAVAVYRELAAARPDVFRPDLARSLSVMANCLEKSDRLDEALLADAEAIAALSSYFRALPAAFAGLMRVIARDYLRRCEKAGREPDGELLAPILEVFQRMQEQDGSGEG